MSWLSELKWSNTDERIMQMVAGDEELDESVVSTYDRKQGFLYKIAQKIASMVGYTVEEAAVTLFDDDVTTEASGGSAGAVLPGVDVTAPTITVTFDDNEYTVDAQDFMGMLVYGEIVDVMPSFDNYPFLIANTGEATTVMTAEAGTYAVKIEAPGYEATTTPEFDAAVKAVGGGTVFVTFEQAYDNSWSCDKTYAEIKSALDKNFPVLAKFKIYNRNDSGWYPMSYDGFSSFSISQGWLDGPNTGVLYFLQAYVTIYEDNTVSGSYSRYGVTYTQA